MEMEKEMEKEKEIHSLVLRWAVAYTMAYQKGQQKGHLLGYRIGHHRTAPGRSRRRSPPGDARTSLARWPIIPVRVREFRQTPS